MKTTTRQLLSSLTIGVLVFASAPAGTLDPPGPPAPTMVTLQQIYERLGTPAPVPKTGQTLCWDIFGNPINCAGTGQDGALQKGVSIPSRFTDNANGTVKDNLTGLVWLKNASCFGQQNWTNALSSSGTLASGACGLTDGSAASAWRLPNIKELQSLIDFGQFFPALPPGHPFTGVQIGEYWSSTADAANPQFVSFVIVGRGFVSIGAKSDPYYVWPVRDGP